MMSLPKCELLTFLTLLSIAVGPMAAAAQGSEQPRIVVRVVDGDTLLLDGDERVRLIGVDTPETVHPRKPVEYFGKEASAFTRQMAEGQEVWLEYEPGDTKDRYGRTLAYVYLSDGTLLNLEIIRQGYGHAYVKYPFSRMDEFREAEREARSAGRGLWANKPEESPPAAYEQTTMGQGFFACATKKQFETHFYHRYHKRGEPDGLEAQAAASACWMIPSGTVVRVLDTYGKKRRPMSTRDFDNMVKKGKGDPVLVEATIHGTLRRGVTWLIALSPE